MATNYVAYMGQKNIDSEWLEGYFQAKKDADAFLSHLQIYEPLSDDPTTWCCLHPMRTLVR